MSCKWLAYWFEIASIFLSYMHETWNVSFVSTVDNMRASHVTAVSHPCMVGCKTCHGCDHNIPALFFCYACCSLHTMPLANISFLWEVFLLGHGILSAFLWCWHHHGDLILNTALSIVLTNPLPSVSWILGGHISILSFSDTNERTESCGIE
jgi:hypothetical protein